LAQEVEKNCQETVIVQNKVARFYGSACSSPSLHVIHLICTL